MKEDKTGQVHSECGSDEGCKGCSCGKEKNNYETNIRGMYITMLDGSQVKTDLKFTGELVEDMISHASAKARREINREMVEGLLRELDDKDISLTEIQSINIEMDNKIDYLVNKEESNLTRHARRELELINAFTKEGDFYGGMTGNAVMELIELFSKQGHSGMSASIVRGIFNELANFDTISPLTLKDDEWCESSDDHFQNNRNSAVFKDSKDGKPYYIDAFYKRTQTGSTWSGNLELKNGWRTGRCYLRPGNTELKKFCIDVFEKEVQKDNEEIEEKGSGWWVTYPTDMSQVVELCKYYDVELVKIS